MGRANIPDARKYSSGKKVNRHQGSRSSSSNSGCLVIFMVVAVASYILSKLL